MHFSGVNLNTNTLTVPIKNNQSLIRVRIPMNLAGYGAPILYFGQVDLNLIVLQQLLF